MMEELTEQNSIPKCSSISLTSPVRAILFDLDETLMNRRKALSAFTEQLIQDYGHDFEVQDPDRIQQLVKQADGGGYIPKTEMYERLVPLLGWREAPATDTFMGYWYRLYPTCAKPEEGLLPTLHYFKQQGLCLGLITNGQTAVQQPKIDLLGIRDLFGSIIVSEAAGCKKPDPAIFQLALRELDVTSAEAWYVGDHPRNDVLGAASAGLCTIWKQGIHDWEHTLPVQPQAVITGLEELIPLYNKHRLT
ncbi:HAD family hydrolase [Paenibacillus cremeus]|uniref:HAD family hydrolase n=1 Tax=Paenibacillus cremeus TaxID=2163881 RepID=A0A559KDG4_9BACL|nr:HAD family hydrolase [Paenibacillus cremeus]TVY10149.1 HAD family hydrolase [Paenibacillus cremeus]